MGSESERDVVLKKEKGESGTWLRMKRGVCGIVRGREVWGLAGRRGRRGAGRVICRNILVAPQKQYRRWSKVIARETESLETLKKEIKR